VPQNVSVLGSNCDVQRNGVVQVTGWWRWFVKTAGKGALKVGQTAKNVRFYVGKKRVIAMQRRPRVHFGTKYASDKTSYRKTAVRKARFSSAHSKMSVSAQRQSWQSGHAVHRRCEFHVALFSVCRPQICTCSHLKSQYRVNLPGVTRTKGCISPLTRRCAESVGSRHTVLRQNLLLFRWKNQ
jgi:hypothetical protein